MGTQGLTRLICAGVAFVGAVAPLIAVTRWPGELILFVLLTIGIGVPLALFVLLVRTRVMTLVTGLTLALVGLFLPVPGYPDFVQGVAGSWGYVLLIMPAILVAIWLIGWIVDLLVRADQRLGDPGRPAPSQSRPAMPALTAAPPRLAIARGVASVPRQPGITVEYRPAASDVPASAEDAGTDSPVVEPPTKPHRIVIDGDVVDRSDHPLG